MANLPDEQADLKTLRQKIEELERSQKHVVSIASHDIKSPLTRLYALLQLMQMTSSNLTDEQKNYLEKMHIVIADSMSMIRNLIDYRNLEFQTVELFPETFDLGEFIRTSIRDFDSVASKKQIRLHMGEIPNCKLVTDKQCFQRAFDNLVSNALKFSFSNKSVTIQAKVDSAMVVIDVRDEAGGFLQAETEKLFQKFQKFSARPTGGESSTGLGLFITRAMMERIKGRVECETKEGVGSVFRLVFPVNLNQLNK